MRDYIVLWRKFDEGLQHFTWHADQPNPDNHAFPPPDPDVSKVYVRVPNQELLLRWFTTNEDGQSPDYYVHIGPVQKAFPEAWSFYFGGDTFGGYTSLDKVPTSDAFGALHGRPARDSGGKFIVNPY